MTPTLQRNEKVTRVGSEMRVSIDGDYIEMEGPRSVAEVMHALARFLPEGRARRSRLGDHSCYPLVRLDGQIEIHIDFAHQGPRTARLAIADLDHNHIRRHNMAHRVYQHLETHSEWRLQWTADDSQDIIAERSWPVSPDLLGHDLGA